MKRKALFIGVNEYADNQIRDLRCSVRDAHSMNDLFEEIGYETRCLENPGKGSVVQAVSEMTAGLKAGDQFLFYFAGHGFTDSGQHLLFCSDDRHELLRFHRAGIPFDLLELETRTGGFDRAFLLDACQSDFLTGTRGGDASTRDLIAIGDMVPLAEDAPGSFYVLRSCSKYEHALEIESRSHGLFTLAMMDVLRQSRRSGTELLFNDVLRETVREKMYSIARGAGMTANQTPESDGRGALQVLVSGRKATVEQVTPQPPPQHHQPAAAPTLVVCPVCGKKNDPRETFKCRECGRDNLCLRHQDETTFLCTKCAAAQRKAHEEAERKAEAERRAREEAERKADAERKARQVAEREEALRNGRCRETGICRTLNLPGGAEMEMIYCPPGEFMMGSPANEEGRYDRETQHRVRLTKGFWLGKYPVTQRQWRSVMGGNPSAFQGDDLPVERVSWDDCQAFIKKVNAALGCGARLPTEAEWEYACRAGTTTAYFWGNALNGNRANCDGNYPCGTAKKGPYLEKTTPVGKYGANPWGLCDMHGNVWEWCADWYGEYPTGSVTDPTGPASGGSRVLRGGSWRNGARYCRSAYRSSSYPGLRDFSLGFRLSCSAGPRGPGAEP